nr:MAG TPA: tail assembly chaperone protein [Caudoviricetes sp.]
MRKIVLVGDQEYELGTNAFAPLAYKQQFGKDFFQEMFLMSKNQSLMNALSKLEGDKELKATDIDISMLEEFDMTFFYRLFWVFAKIANPLIKPYEQFFMEMEVFPIQEVGPVLMEMLNASVTTKKHQMSQNQLAKKSSQ